MRKSCIFLLLCLSCLITACRGSSTQPETEEETVEETEPWEKTYKVGDTINTGLIEFKLSDFELTDRVCLDSGDDYYYLPTPEDYEVTTVGKSKDGYTMAYLSYSIQNVGKTDLEGIGRKTPTGGNMFTSGTHDIIDIDWNGYIFDGNQYCIGLFLQKGNGIQQGSTYGWGYDDLIGRMNGGSKSIWTEKTAVLKILTDPEYIRCFFALSDKVKDEDTPLDVIVYLPGQDEDGNRTSTQPYRYVIR